MCFDSSGSARVVLQGLLSVRVAAECFSVQEEDSNNVHVFGSGNVGYSGSTFSCVAWLGGQSVCVCVYVSFLSSRGSFHIVVLGLLPLPGILVQWRRVLRNHQCHNIR